MGYRLSISPSPDLMATGRCRRGGAARTHCCYWLEEMGSTSMVAMAGDGGDAAATALMVMALAIQCSFDKI
ncbi:hypothetical protein ACLOJK_018890 [Asimina triloba]